MEKITELLCPEFGRNEEVTVVEIMKKVGDAVKLGDAVFSVEAGKGLTKVYALSDGFIKEFKVKVADKVKMDDVMATITDTRPAAEKITELLCPEFGLDEISTITEVLKKAGDAVKLGEPVFAVEAGKGASKIYSLCDGYIKEIKAAAGQKVKTDEVVALITDTAPEAAPAAKETFELLCPEFGKDEKVTVTRIHKNVGDAVKLGEAFASVEAGKGASKIYCLKDGILEEIKIKVGDKIMMDDVVALFSEGTAEQAVPAPVDKTEPADMDTKKADVLVIGGGPGGYVAAIYAAQNGKKVIIAEKEKLGGTCLNVGCIPTKSFVKSSEVYSESLRGDEFGIKIAGAVPDMKGIVAHKERVVDKLVSGVEFLMKKNSIEVARGTASFIDEKTVEITGFGKVAAEDIIIATGSSVSKSNIPGLDLPVVMNSTDALSNDVLPESVTIIGGGVIGMEFAFIYANLGVKVRVVEFMVRVLTMIDNDVSAEIMKIAKEKGITISTSSRVTKVRQAENGSAVVFFEKDGTEHMAVSEKVLFAIGRSPNMDGLNLEATGIELNDRGRGIKVDGHMRTNREHIYAIGDVTNIIQLAHVASEQGIVAVDNILGKDRLMDYSAVPNVVFTDPEIASVGITEDEAKAKGIDYSVARFDFAGNGKAVSMGRTEGFVKLIKDNSEDRLLGGTIIGPDARSLINVITLAIQNKMKVEAIADTIFPHPTTGEAVHEAVLGLGLGSIHQ
ncbi:MAG: dihydrolipoyl dehydrogenase [Oscillospiraceae bacterium]|nr:dihydrolipoyl dehydrogenase [Oscillospiraceae bacterium]